MESDNLKKFKMLVQDKWYNRRGYPLMLRYYKTCVKLFFYKLELKIFNKL